MAIIIYKSNQTYRHHHNHHLNHHHNYCHFLYQEKSLSHFDHHFHFHRFILAHCGIELPFCQRLFRASIQPVVDAAQQLNGSDVAIAANYAVQLHAAFDPLGDGGRDVFRIDFAMRHGSSDRLKPLPSSCCRL